MVTFAAAKRNAEIVDKALPYIVLGHQKRPSHQRGPLAMGWDLRHSSRGSSGRAERTCDSLEGDIEFDYV